MSKQPMLDQVELQQVDKVEADENEVLEQHSVPALEGDFLQDLGRRAIRVALTGTLTGPAAGDGLKTLREKFRAAEPVPFVEDIATATKIDKVLIEEMDVRELAGKPERFEYALTLLEFTPPPKPESEPPPPPPPPPPKTDSGKLIVEVTIAGQPNADVSSAIVSLEGNQDDGTALSRTLSDRSNNVWNDDAVPTGSYTAKATMTASPAMVGTADAKISAGQTTKVSIVLQPGALVATEFVVHFRFDKAFVEPCMREVLQQVIDHAAAHPDEKLVIVGHTDLVGSPSNLTGPDPYNQSLSERRARGVYAFLTFGRDKDNAMADWTELRKKQTGQVKTLADNWGTRQYQHMLQDLGFYPGNVDGQEGKQTQDAVRAFRRKHGLPDGTTVDDDVWTALIGDYLGQDNFAIPDSQFFRNCGDEPLKWLGCASQDPVNRTRQAHRPNRRVELLFITTDKFPCSVPQPDTFDLPSKGAVGSGWCMNPDNKAQDSKRACFVVPHLPADGKPTHGEWSRQVAEPGTITVQVSIKKEVKKADGSTELQPAPGQKFVLTAADGEFLASELSSGEPQPAVTKSNGTQSFADKPLGIYSLELLAPVLVRLAEDDPANAKGNAVCKHLTADDNHLDVIILPEPPLREINLRAAVHLMTALTPAVDAKAKTRIVRTCPDPLDPTKSAPQATAHKASEIPDIFAGANEIWRQGRVHFDPVNIVEETYSFRTECEVDDNEFATVLERCAYPNVTNVFFFGDLAGPGEAGEFALVSIPPPDPRGQVDGCAVSDRTQQQLFQNAPPVNITLTKEETIQVLAHELGHYLGLAVNNNHPTGATQLMRAGTSDGSNRTLTSPEVTDARNSNNAALEFVPVSLKVTGAAQIGGSLSHEFLVIQNSTPPPPAIVTVDAVISDAAGTVSMSGGGNPGANSQESTVSTANKRVTEVDATFTPAGGGPPVLARVEVRVATFNLRVDGATQVAGTTTFVTKTNPTDPVVVTVELDPAPFCIPATLIQWKNGDETPDPLRRTVSKKKADSITVSATITGITQSVTINVIQIEVTKTASATEAALTFVGVGLWDGAFDASGNVLNKEAEADNFVGADSRKFHIRVHDSSKHDRIDVGWRTTDQAGNAVDAPAVNTVTLTESGANSGIFLSKGLMLVTDNDDQNQATHSGLPAGVPDGGLVRNKGESNHRTRRGSMLGNVAIDYKVGSVLSTEQVPLFQRSPEDRRRVPLQFFVLRNAVGGPGVIPTGPTDSIWSVDLRVFRESYARLGIQVDTVVAPGTPPADIVKNGSDSIVLIDPPAGVVPGNVSLANESTISTAHPAIADTIRVFYVGGLASGNGGESFADINAAGDPRLGTAFTIQSTGPYAAAHEVGHILTNKIASANTGHFNAPTVPAGNRLRNDQNLMRKEFLGPEKVNGSKRLWDAADADGLNQFTSIRGSHYTRTL